MGNILDQKGIVREVQDGGETVREPLDRGRVSQDSVDSLKTAVNEINDTPTRQALGEIVEILTGETILEE